MFKFLLLLPLVGALFVAKGCAIGTPFTGPRYDRSEGVTAELPHATVVVAITHAVLDGSWSERREFFRQTQSVLDGLPEQDGLVGYSVRRELLGDEAWTMTVWTDATALARFVRSRSHRTAVREGSNAMARSRFARIEIAPGELPLRWERALEILDEQNGAYEAK